MKMLKPLGFLAIVTLGCCEPTSLVAAVVWVTVILGACVWVHSIGEFMAFKKYYLEVEDDKRK